ncbi:protein transport protein Sec16A-like isoform X1 [Alosa alosa]|uniref:protein transport protein Sec16A-like isoform X1 n=2 Tax=Alosa alosa TaxID=278164 RepID=UPI0020153B9A|nr:protein transport protein Sec16A-like isoform X1 [Alosa alosa]
MHRIDSLDLAGCHKRHLKPSKLFKAIRKQGLLPKQVQNLRTCDYVDPSRDQGLGDAPSRVFKTPPETLQRSVKQDQVLPIQHFAYKTDWKDYLGPFDMGVTYTVSIYKFAMKKWQRCLRTTWLMDKEAAGLVWGLLALVCRETRRVMGQHIAKLLISNPLAFEKDENLLSSGEGHQALVNLIIFGKKEEAEQLAKRDALWDHWVILKGFAKGSCDAIVLRLIEHLKANDPMKTYFQILMGKVPAAACEWGKNSWGDWRPHLAMVLCYMNQNILKKDIMETMAETLASHGKPNSAYLCDIIMHLHCGIFLEWSKLRIRGIRSRPFLRSTRAAVERMEVYDYVLGLRTDQPFISEYQHYRTLYSRMLLRAGYIQQALHFCESVGTTLIYSADVNRRFLADFVKLCSEFHVSQRDFIAPRWMYILRDMAERIILNKEHRSAAIKAPEDVKVVEAEVAPEKPGTATTSPDHQSGPGTATTSPDHQPDTATTSPDNQPDTATTSPGHQSGPGTITPDHQFDPGTSTSAHQSGSGSATTSHAHQSGSGSATTSSGSATTSHAHQSGSGSATTSSGSATNYHAHQSGPGTATPDHQSGTATTSPGHQPGTATTSPGHQSITATTSPGHQSGPAISSPDQQSGPAISSPDQQSCSTTTEKTKKKKNKGCFGWLSCFRCFCFRRKKMH